MALSDLNHMHQRFVVSAANHLKIALEAFDGGDREHFYLKLALASSQLERVLAVIEDPKYKPRNESANGPLPAREKRAH